MARIVVTGAAGFIGSHLVERLLYDGHTVLGIDMGRRGWGNLHTVREHSAFTPFASDLLAPSLDLTHLLAGADAVIHLAGQPGVRESWCDFPAYSRGNIETTQRLLEALCTLRERDTAGPPRFVLASTSAIYGDAALPAREDHPPRPVSPYGLTKATAEQLCALYEATAGLPWVALRYFTVYGPRQRPDMALRRWLEAVRRGEPIRLFGDGTQCRDFTYVDDVVEATRRAALATDLPNGPLNVGSGHPVSMNAALDLIGQIHGAPLQIEHLPAGRGDLAVTHADPTRLRERLGYVPTTKLTDGLVTMWRWCDRGPR